MTTAIDPVQFMDAFAYVQNTFKNIAELLTSGDTLVRRHGFFVYGDLWKAANPLTGSHFKLSNVDEWVPHFVIRQYAREGRFDKEALTLGVLPWDRLGKASHPWAIASYVRLKTSAPTSVYSLPLCQVRSRFGADGVVRHLAPADLVDYGAERLKEFAEVIDGDVLSVAVPLLEIQSAADLQRRLVDPLCGALQARSAA